MTSVLNNESIKELSENRLERVGDMYVKVKKPQPPPLVMNNFRGAEVGRFDEFEQQNRAQ